MVTTGRLPASEPASARGAFAFWGLRAKTRAGPAAADPTLPFEIAPRLWAFLYDEDRTAWRDSVHRHVLSARCV